ncbi:lipocalin family protein [Marixanthomonas ophiurae]|uniref:Uncharacterized protein n=1 Tax=Marixanthomonas ophiurae TaxID=387659 RepID=A0A3E1QC67_9FLAO|nr:lipocalin family protein [Marixanthomonas ophiurae]RFN59723.1 hypothetical protein DZ858_06630 [Marixanthomonas ophiurae]
MKLTKLLFLTILTFSIISCSKDDDSKETNDTSSSLVGSWKATDFSYESTSRTEGQGTTIESESTGIAKELDITVEFSEDPNTYEVDSDYVLEITTESSGDTIIQEIPIQYSGTGTWSKEGNTLSIIENNEEREATITELTNSKLTYTSTTTQTQTQSGITSTVEVTETLSFSKQ